MRPNKLYPENWDRIRHYVFQRDHYTCQLCGRKVSNPHCHHIIPIGKGGSSTPDNLITLCEECHKYLHDGHYYLNNLLKARIKNPI